MVHVVWACALLPWLAASVTPPADAPPMPPADDFCTPPFGDCRETLCCSDESQSCFRRPHVYFAQCRPHNSACGDGSADEWLCPGWEACVDEGDECAFSRCCKDDNHGCFLNRTLYAATGAWHAKCEPASVTRHASNNRLQLHTVAEGEALLDVDIIDSQNVTTDKFFYLEVASKVAFCESSNEQKCKGTWRHDAGAFMKHLDAAAEELLTTSGLSPKVIVGLVAGSTLVGLCAVVCALAYRRSLLRELQKVDRELRDLREAKREQSERRRETALTEAEDGMSETGGASPAVRAA